MNLHLPTVNPDLRSDLITICGRGVWLPRPIRASRIIVHLRRDEWVNITDPAASTHPAHVVDAVTGGQTNG